MIVSNRTTDTARCPRQIPMGGYAAWSAFLDSQSPPAGRRSSLSVAGLELAEPDVAHVVEPLNVKIVVFEVHGRLGAPRLLRRGHARGRQTGAHPRGCSAAGADSNRQESFQQQEAASARVPTDWAGARVVVGTAPRSTATIACMCSHSRGATAATPPRRTASWSPRRRTRGTEYLRGAFLPRHQDGVRGAVPGRDHAVG